MVGVDAEITEKKAELNAMLAMPTRSICSPDSYV
jgi:hypothetical protein